MRMSFFIVFVQLTETPLILISSVYYEDAGADQQLCNYVHQSYPVLIVLTRRKT